ncbi:MAG: alpha/beta fold hydrolase [Longimicrobiales bacterium]
MPSTAQATSRALPQWLDRQAYPFQSHWLELPSLGQMHYVDEGAGPAVLFVHGTPTWSFEWRHLIRTLSGRYRCIAPDLLGMGLSDRPGDFAYSPEAHADALAALVRQLGLERFTLIVHDFGGPIGLPLLFDSPARVNGVVLINTWAWSLADDAGMARRARVAGGGFGRFLYRWFNASLRLIMPSAYGDRRRLTPEIHGQYLSVFTDRAARVQVLWQFARALLGSSAFFDRLWQQRARLREKPVLIVWGMKDSAFEPRMLRRWQEALPDARVTELAVGHWPHEEAPVEVQRSVSEFLQYLDPQAPYAGE